MDIHLEQGTDEWLKWRAGKSFTDTNGITHPALEDEGPRVTATAASVCAGLSPFQTPHQLWLETLGFRKREVASFVMQRGNDMEPHARAAYCEIVGEEYEPVCVQSDKTPWIAASLDGRDMLRTRGLEIKCPISEKTHGFALNGEVPPYYYDQIQWQHLAEDNRLELIDYFSFAPKMGKAAPIAVLPDLKRQQEILEASIRFRVAVMTRVPLSGNEFDQAAKAFLVLNRKLSAIKEQVELAKEEVKKIANGKPMQGGGVIVTVSNTSGKVSWEKIANDLIDKYKVPENELDDLKALYRGAPSITVAVKESAEADAIYQSLVYENIKLGETSVVDTETAEVRPQPNPNW